MSTINSWKAFIKAQEIFVNQYSEPFSIVFKEFDKAGLASFTIEQTNPLSNILFQLEKSFPGILQNDINITEGYLLYDSSRSPLYKDELKEIAELNYFDFDPEPCFSGEVKLKEDPYRWLTELNISQPNAEGVITATLSDIGRIDDALINKENFSRAANIGAVFKVKPSEYYLKKQQFNLIEKLLVDRIGIKSIRHENDFSNFIIEDIFIKKPLLQHILNNTIYSKACHQLIFIVHDDAFQYFLSIKSSKGIFFKSEEKGDNKVRIILPDPIGNAFHFSFDSIDTLAELQSEIFHYESLFYRYFGYDSFEIKHWHIFSITKKSTKSIPFDKSLFFENLESISSEDRFNISATKETISFNFTNEDELNEGINELREIKIAEIDFKENDHGFKIKLQYRSPLLTIQEKLRQIPAIKTKLIDDGLKLLFFCSFDNHDLLQLLVANIKDAIDSMLNENMQCAFDELLEGKLKYFLDFKHEEYETEINSKFNYLRGEEISICDLNKPLVFGSIAKVNLPSITIEMEAIREEICTPFNKTLVFCALKGERDKIKRLSNTVDIIFSTNKHKILNEKLRTILMDSSKAESFQGDILHTGEYEKSIDEINSSLLSKNINQRQKEAIAKCLLAKDFFLIQGPPGTGKSTAIAELIWQHIRSFKNLKKGPFRILVTSETNLAVDNALDKLRSKNHLLIKPIRFGSDDKLDKEGRRFSLESLKQWALVGNKELAENKSATNILQDWITLISNRALCKKTVVNGELYDKWLNYLNDTNDHLRSLFFDNYVQHVNVIGATCSSIGKENSEQKFTRFFCDYCDVVHTKEYSAFRLSLNKSTITALRKKNIEFDLVVQDEASKASPPELALPCLYGKKAVVIGDHRQLPPMVDTNEFVDNLNMMSKKTKDENNRKEITDLIRYIKKNNEEFSISHFEKLFNAIDENLKSTFKVQYRMHPAINETIKQFYAADGGLECGIPGEIADSEDMSHPLNRFHGATANKKTHVIWLDVNTPEIKNGTSRVNFGEVEAVDWLLSYFKKSPGFKNFIDYWPAEEVEQKQIGIITFYGAQASLLTKLKDKYPDVPLRISPVDRFQGMERNIVIVSLVRSNSIAGFPSQAPNMEAYPGTGYPSQESLGFAEFPNRLNVALSRAKRLLIIVGNSQHFRRHEIYNNVYETIQHHPNGAVKTFEPKSLK